MRTEWMDKSDPTDFPRKKKSRKKIPSSLTLYDVLDDAVVLPLAVDDDEPGGRAAVVAQVGVAEELLVVHHALVLHEVVAGGLAQVGVAAAVDVPQADVVAGASLPRLWPADVGEAGDGGGGGGGGDDQDEEELQRVGGHVGEWTYLCSRYYYYCL